MDFYFHFIRFSFPCLFNTTLLESVGVNASKEAIWFYFSSFSGGRKMKRFSGSSAEKIKIENTSGAVHTAPKTLLWPHLTCPAVVTLVLLPSVYFLTLLAGPLLSQISFAGGIMIAIAQNCPLLWPGLGTLYQFLWESLSNCPKQGPPLLVLLSSQTVLVCAVQTSTQLIALITSSKFSALFPAERGRPLWSTQKQGNTPPRALSIH